MSPIKVNPPKPQPHKTRLPYAYELKGKSKEEYSWWEKNKIAFYFLIPASLILLGLVKLFDIIINLV